MATCCGGASAVVIQSGDGLSVSGSGTTSDPYIISGDIEVAMVGQDSSTIDMTINGSGVTSDPFVVRADATLSVNDLVDVNDLTAPVLGDVLQFDGNDWVYGPPPAQAPGQVNTSDGVAGDGTLSSPVRVAVSEAVEDSTSGLYTYIDSNGELRAEVRGVTWGSVTGKPTSFNPSAHTHPNSELTGILTGSSAPGPGAGSDGDIFFQHT